jgi:hypothetical protein
MTPEEKQARIVQIKKLQEEIKYHLLIRLALCQDEDIIFLLQKL